MNPEQPVPVLNLGRTVRVGVVVKSSPPEEMRKQLEKNEKSQRELAQARQEQSRARLNGNNMINKAFVARFVSNHLARLPVALTDQMVQTMIRRTDESRALARRELPRLSEYGAEAKKFWRLKEHMTFYRKYMIYRSPHLEQECGVESYLMYDFYKSLTGANPSARKSGLRQAYEDRVESHIQGMNVSDDEIRRLSRDSVERQKDFYATHQRFYRGHDLAYISHIIHNNFLFCELFEYCVWPLFRARLHTHKGEEAMIWRNLLEHFKNTITRREPF